MIKSNGKVKTMNKKIVLFGLIFMMLLFTNVAMAVAPTLTNQSPANSSTLWDMDTTTISININCTNGTFNWTLDTSPDIGNNSGYTASNGSKTCTISGLLYSTTYTWIVNSTNGTLWTNATYTFTTRDAKLRENPALSVVEKAIVGVVGLIVLLGFLYVIIKMDMKKEGQLAKILVGLIVALALLGVIFTML